MVTLTLSLCYNTASLIITNFYVDKADLLDSSRFGLTLAEICGQQAILSPIFTILYLYYDLYQLLRKMSGSLAIKWPTMFTN